MMSFKVYRFMCTPCLYMVDTHTHTHTHHTLVKKDYKYKDNHSGMHYCGFQNITSQIEMVDLSRSANSSMRWSAKFLSPGYHIHHAMTTGGRANKNKVEQNGRGVMYLYYHDHHGTIRRHLELSLLQINVMTGSHPIGKLHQTKQRVCSIGSERMRQTTHNAIIGFRIELTRVQEV